MTAAKLRVLPAAERTKLIETIRRYLESRTGIQFAYLHGSFLTGGAYRDIDLALFIDPAIDGAPTRDRDSLPGDIALRYTLDLATELTVALGQPVDVQVLNNAALAFRHRVLEGQPLLVRDSGRLDEFRARTWDAYFDFLPFARRYLRDVLSA